MNCSRFLLPRPTGFRVAAASALLALPASLFLTPSAQATNLTWDPLATGTGSDGSGTWNNTTPALFSNGSTDVTYTSMLTAPSTAVTTSGTNTITVSAANSALLVVGQAVSSASFPAGTVISSINTATGVVTMSANSTAAITSGTVLAFAPPDVALFGKGTGAAGTVTVSGTQGANSMTVNAAGSGAYTFTGGTITLGSNNGSTGILTLNAANQTTTINSLFNSKGVTFTAANQTLKLGGGSSITGGASSVVMFNAGTISGSSTNGLTSTVELTAGTYQQGGGSGTYNIGNVATGTGGLIIDAGATINSSVSFQASANGVINLNGGTINETAAGNFVVGRGGAGRFILNSGTLNSTSTGSMLVGFQNATGTADINGGALNVSGTLVLNSPGNTSGAGGTAVVNITGTSVAKINGINFGKAADFTGTATSGTGTLNVKGGALYVGAGGIVKTGTGTYTSTINLSGGTVGATTNWSSALDVNLSNADGGVTIKTADVNNVAHDISLSGKLTGTGGFTVAGGTGTLNITGTTNDYTGATTVNGGRLAIGANNALSTASSVTLGGGTIGFATGNFSQGNSSTAGLGALTLNSTSVIDFAGGDDLIHFAASNGQTWTGTLSIYNWTAGNDSLYFGTNNSALTGTQLSQISFYSDNGTTLLGTGAWAGSNGLVTAVPEPKDWAVMSLGLCALLVIKRRRRMMSAA